MNHLWVYLPLMLLPVAAGTGWWLAFRTMRQSDSKSDKFLPPEYFKGLNYVLNEEPDKAIEVFIRMLEVDSNTVETHLALANLFRRRGEVDRAIRIHQNLIARPTLTHEERSQALLELGMDYMRSGLLDRAEGLFKELVESGLYTIKAYRELVDIYQQEKEWENAIAMARRLEAASGERMNAVIAQYYCELAEEAIARKNEKETRDYIKRALNIDPRCVRASQIEAEIAHRAGRYKAALQAYRRVEKQDPGYLPEIIVPLAECYREQGRLDEGIRYLHEIEARYGGVGTLLKLSSLIEEQQGRDAAIAYISSSLEKRPSVKVLSKLMEYMLAKTDGDVQANLKIIKEMTDRLISGRAIYRCGNCGFDAMSLHWQCPGCKAWSTIKPVHGVDGD